MTSNLREELIDRIRRDGPMPFAAFMSLALYHPRHGYYTEGQLRTGWRGHFLTSPEIDPAFGELWARAFEQVWTAAGRPREFDIVEIGPGEGGFSAGLLAALSDEFADAVTYRMVERSPAAQARQQERLQDLPALWHPSIDDVPPIAAGCVFANEVLDNLPVHLMASRDGESREVWVDTDGSDLIEIEREPSTPQLAEFIERFRMHPSPDGRIDIGLAAESFTRHCTRLLSTGALIFVDYGASAEALSKRGSTLLCYSDAGIDDDPLDRPGEKDITAHVNWTSIASCMTATGLDVAGSRPQRDVLLGLGLRDLDQDLRTQHSEALSAHSGSAAVSALSRRQALGVLADPNGLGGLDVLVGTRGIPTPGFML